MPLIIGKSSAKTGKGLSCTCGRCTTCVTRERVARWREGQKEAKLKLKEEALKRELNSQGD